jgi:hypothetical protein
MSTQQKIDWKNARYAEASAKLDPNDPHYAAKAASLSVSYRAGLVPTLMLGTDRPAYLMTEAQARQKASNIGENFASWQPETYMTTSGPQQFWIYYQPQYQEDDNPQQFADYGSGDLFAPSFYSTPFDAHAARAEAEFDALHANMNREAAANQAAVDNLLAGLELQDSMSLTGSGLLTTAYGNPINSASLLSGPGLRVDPASTQWGLMPSHTGDTKASDLSDSAEVYDLSDSTESYLSFPTHEEHMAMLNESLENMELMHVSGEDYVVDTDKDASPPTSSAAIEGAVIGAANNAGVTQPSIVGSGLRLGSAAVGWGLHQGQRAQENLMLEWTNILNTGEVLANNADRFARGSLSGGEVMDLTFNYASSKLGNPLDNGSSFVWEGVPDIIRNVAVRGGSGSTNVFDLIRNQTTTVGYQFVNPQRTSGIVLTVGENGGDTKWGVEWRAKLGPD